MASQSSAPFAVLGVLGGKLDEDRRIVSNHGVKIRPLDVHQTHLQSLRTTLLLVLRALLHGSSDTEEKSDGFIRCGSCKDDILFITKVTSYPPAPYVRSHIITLIGAHPPGGYGLTTRLRVSFFVIRAFINFPL